MKKMSLIPVVITAALTSLATALGISIFSDIKKPETTVHTLDMPVHYTSGASYAGQTLDFSAAAEESVKSVVHITTKTEGKTVRARDPFDPFGVFGLREYKLPNQVGAGSGVIISEDGYIVTNNHVVAGANEVLVTFNDRNTETAKVIGTDPATDLAVLKIDANNLKYMTLGNSDNVKLGQWVLAVGYPLNLDATVTAGIVSAKGRALGVNHKNSSSAIEAYIQTDAAVNPGNSGGPLVSTDGLLIGINSAIASPTGSYAGYSYAIPSNIVEKVAKDIIEFGSVKRGYLGVSLADLNENAAAQLGISKEEFRKAEGVYVSQVEEGSGAAKADIRKGDFITAVNGMKVTGVPQLQGTIARYHPGDKISVTINRNGNSIIKNVELKNSFGNNSISGKDNGAIKLMGAVFRNLNPKEGEKYGITSGAVIIDDVQQGQINQIGIRKGFILLSVNDKRVKNINDLQQYLNASNGDIQLGGMYPGRRGMYYYGLQGGESRY